MREALGEYCDIISGYAFKSSDLEDIGDVPVIKIGNINDGGNVIIDNTTQYVSNKFLSIDMKYHIHFDDILISLTGSHMNQPNSMVGRSCRSYENTEFLLNQRAGKVICKDITDSDYFYYLLNTKAVKESIVARAYGAANQVNISPSDILKIKIEIHDEKRRKRIGEIISSYDKLIESKNKQISILEHMAEKIYEEWFVHFRYPGNETIKLVDDTPNGWKVASINHDKRPINWHYGMFSELGRFVRGKNITTADMIDGDVPVISAGIDPSGYHNVSNVQGKSLTISASGANAGFLKYNLNDIWAADCSYYQNDMYFWFAYHTLHFLQPVIMNLQNGSAQPHVYPKHINGLTILIPTKDIILHFCEIIKPIYEEIKELQSSSRNLLIQRNLLLPRLMNSKLAVK